MCVFRLIYWENILSQSLHTWGLSSVWVLMCVFRLQYRENVLSQTMHKWGLSPVWVLMCDFRWQYRENVLSQTMHTWGFSPVWILMCVLRLPYWENVLSQSLQVWDFSPVSHYVSLQTTRNRECLELTCSTLVWLFTQQTPRLVWPLGPFEDWPHQLSFTKVDSTAPPPPPPSLRPHDFVILGTVKKYKNCLKLP